MKNPHPSPPSKPTGALDVLVMGSLFVELVPDEAGASLVNMNRLIPTASGAAANFALALAALGPHVGLLARVGDDELGEWLRRQLEQAGIDMEATLATPGQFTPVSFAWADLCGGKQFTFYRFPGLCDPLGALSPASLDRPALARARLFDFTEAVVRRPGVREVAFQAAGWCRDAGTAVIYAVNYRPQSWDLSLPEIAAVQRQAISFADVALMNEEEHQLIFGDHPAHLSSTILVVTAGDRGGWVQQGHDRWPFAARAVQVQYDVGAGDSFHAGYVAAYLENRPPLEAAHFAAACAALKVSQPPAACPATRAQVVAFMEEPTNRPTGD